MGKTGNGSTAKSWRQSTAVEIKTPRDRKASFEPQLVRKGQRRFEGSGRARRLLRPACPRPAVVGFEALSLPGVQRAPDRVEIGLVGKRGETLKR